MFNTRRLSFLTVGIQELPRCTNNWEAMAVGGDSVNAISSITLIRVSAMLGRRSRRFQTLEFDMVEDTNSETFSIINVRN